MRKLILLASMFISVSVFAQKDARAVIISEQSHDTLEIKDPSIHFIKIGNGVYEIVRKVELKKTEPETPIWLMRSDTTRPLFVPYVDNLFIPATSTIPVQSK